MTRFIGNMGNVDDVKCSLKHFETNHTATEAEGSLRYLKESLVAESRDKNRQTVIKMIKATMLKIKAAGPDTSTVCDEY